MSSDPSQSAAETAFRAHRSAIHGLGHYLPASAFFGFGAFFLALSLRRARSLPPGASFTESHVPERNAQLMKWASLVVFAFTSIGFVAEIAGLAIIHPDRVFKMNAHEMMYTQFAFVGAIMMLEARRRLPEDSHRAALVMVFCLQYIVWYDHAKMKTKPVDASLHMIIALICLTTAAAFGASILKPSSITSYIGSWSMMVLLSCWLVTTGLYSDETWDIHEHDLPIILCSEILGVASIVLSGYVFFGPSLQSPRVQTSIGSSGVNLSKTESSESEEYECLNQDLDEKMMSTTV